ncbi:hypothetical protein BDY19DRAFT_378801 [Irpex rosettiformis]|uniref:Uncharacterized protein n=1 Tax=Irpex rosettiformis TaxID=378272 RepID=A0ACB8TVI5_9APHY|nr:hypothetical protein BDY19DRAFT_378801 [Irpex rosettiformis]
MASALPSTATAAHALISIALLVSVSSSTIRLTLRPPSGRRNLPSVTRSWWTKDLRLLFFSCCLLKHHFPNPLISNSEYLSLGLNLKNNAITNQSFECGPAPERASYTLYPLPSLSFVQPFQFSPSDHNVHYDSGYDCSSGRCLASNRSSSLSDKSVPRTRSFTPGTSFRSPVEESVVPWVLVAHLVRTRAR